MTKFHIGISGWTYKPWKKNFYPEGLAAKRELNFASRKVNSIEINGTFYRLQTPKSFGHWYDETPEDFVFSVKASRYITHVHRIHDGGGLPNFFASGLLALKEKLGPILWQFSPNMKYDKDRFEQFFKLLPHDTDQAGFLAARSDLSSERSVTKATGHRSIAHAVEIRHDSFRNLEFIELLRQYNIALVFADTKEWPYMEDVTGPVIYARLHGSEELYLSGYSDTEIDKWAGRFRLWSQGSEPSDSKRIGPPARPETQRDVFVYFDNDVKVHAPFNAQSLAERLNRTS